MPLPEIIEQLILLHKRYSNSRRSNKESQMCTLWSTSNPPDILENTRQLIAIEKALGFTFKEDDVFEFYEMEIEEAAVYILDLMNEEGGK
ncbi:MAG: hypothetical protein ACI85O_000267 [Saprospiraceae bacterium]|jgi:hypothetical protein